MRLFSFIGLTFIFILAACGGSGGAVVFAPTAMPVDTSPILYTHSSGSFTMLLPRQWSVYERNTTTLASATFSPNNQHTPLLTVATVRLQSPPTDPNAINTMLDTYQTQVRSDSLRYVEQSREVMGDGSWRLTGLRREHSGRTEQVNTFVEVRDEMLGVIDVIITDDPQMNRTLQQAINTFDLLPALEPTALDTLSFATSGQLTPLNVHAWTTSDGVFFITGEVMNTADEPVTDVPVTVTLLTQDGRAVVEAIDRVMGYGIPPGGFAPFSLRFGGGQPALTDRYRLLFGGDGWTPEPETLFFGDDVLAWTDSSTLTEANRLVVTGEITNVSADIFVYLPRVIVTVFDTEQRVIAAGFSDLTTVEIAPGSRVPFEVVIPEMGGIPSRYIVTVQGQP